MMAKAQGKVVRVTEIRLRGYFPHIMCPRCRHKRDAGEFVVPERMGDPQAFVQATECRHCTGAAPEYVKGMFVRDLKDTQTGEALRWQQHRQDGTRSVPYGVPKDVALMGFRLMRGGVVLPQPNLQSGLRHRAGEQTGSLFEEPKKKGTRRRGTQQAPPPQETAMRHDANTMVEQAVRQMLTAIGEDTGRDGLQRTPERVAKSMLRDLFSGYYQDPNQHVTLFEPDGYDGIVLVSDMPLVSTCEHHMLPFTGVCHVAYIPNGKVIGLSKFARIVDVFARRLQVQERLTHQIAEFLHGALLPQGLMVRIEAEHTCMTIRGVQKPGSRTSTSELRGAFKDDAAARAEVFQLLADRSR